jgi:hypothetical protein
LSSLVSKEDGFVTSDFKPGNGGSGFDLAAGLDRLLSSDEEELSSLSDVESRGAGFVISAFEDGAAILGSDCAAGIGTLPSSDDEELSSLPRLDPV